PPTENNAKKRKAKDDKASKTKKRSKSDKAKKKKSGLVESKALRNRGAPVASGTEPEDESMVAPGGPALDDDAEEHVERPKTGKKKKGIPTDPLINIKHVAPKAPTRRLFTTEPPNGLSGTFLTVPRPSSLKKSFLWPANSIDCQANPGDHRQSLRCWQHLVTADSAWVGLIGYRLSDWRSGIAMQATKAIQTLIDMYEDEDAESGPESEEVTAVTILPVDDEGPVPAANPVPKVLKFTFDTPEGIAAFVEWALQPHERAEQWPFIGKHGGFFQSHLIAYTFAYHLTGLAMIPDSYTPLIAPAIGALLLSVQATGEYMNPQKPSSHFSVNNWGDTTIRIHNRDKQVKGKVVRRATKFLRSVQQWDQARWDELKEAASEWVETPTRKRAASSRSASEAGDDLMMSDDDEPSKLYHFSSVFLHHVLLVPLRPYLEPQFHIGPQPYLYWLLNGSLDAILCVWPATSPSAHRTEVNRAWARGSGEGQGEQDSHEPAGGVATSTGDLGISDLSMQERTDAGHWIPGVGLLEALIYLTVGNQVFAPRNRWSIKSLAFGFRSSGRVPVLSINQ
ncbi:hypothetical protein B0H10DRAFT_1943446, partial [Mycena sp. CBHHK59/15]